MRKFFRGAYRKISDSYWLRSGTYTFMNKVSVVLFGFINFYILIRILSKETFGAWVLFISIAALMETIKRGFIRNPLIRYLTLSPDHASSIQTASLLLNVLTNILELTVLYLCSIFLSDFWDLPALESLFKIYMLTTVFIIPINHFDIIQHARLQFKGPFISNFVRHFGLFLFIMIAFVFKFPLELEHLAYAQLIAVAVSAFVSFRYARKYLRLKRGLDRKWLSELRSYGFFTFGTNVSSMINKNIDSWMLARMISPAAVTLFNPAIRISNLVEVPSDTLTSILFPKLAQRIAEEGPGSAKYLYEKAVGTITACMLPIVVIFIALADPVVQFVAGPGFEETVPILQVTMLYGLMIPFNRFFGITLDAMGRAKTNFLQVVRNALINLVSNYFYISHFGIIGAAYGTFTTYLVVLILNQFFLYRFLNVRFANVVRHIFETYLNVFTTGVKIFRKAF